MKSQTKYYPSQFNNNLKGFKRLKPVDPKFKARELPSLIVTHESVVATMDLVVDDEHTMVKIWWGDEGGNTQPTIIDLRRIRALPINNTLPRNTFRFQHKYDENAPSRKIILVQSIGIEPGPGISTDNLVSTWESRVIEIDPVYKFICYPLVLEINSHFDTGFESESEFDINLSIRQGANTLFEDQWNEDIDTNEDNYPVLYTVDGSSFSKDIPFSDDPIYFNLHIKEQDNLLKDIFDILASFPVEFDGSTRISPSFHPRDYTGSKDFREFYDLNDGSLNVLLRTEMRLIVPLDKTDELLAHA